MSISMILLDTQGPLPLKATFDSPISGAVVFVLSGTAWTTKAPALIGVTLALDGAIIGKAAMCYANLNSNHQALRTTFILFDKMTLGEHTITIQSADPNTVTDLNDYFQVTLLI